MVSAREVLSSAIGQGPKPLSGCSAGPGVALQVQIGRPRVGHVRSCHRRAVRTAWGERHVHRVPGTCLVPGRVDVCDRREEGPAERFCRRRAGQPDRSASEYRPEQQVPE